MEYSALTAATIITFVFLYACFVMFRIGLLRDQTSQKMQKMAVEISQENQMRYK